MNRRTLALPLIRALSRSLDDGIAPSDRRYCFILSTGRTGTTFLGHHFDGKPGVVAVHEPRPSWRLRLLSGARLEGLVDDRELAEHLRSLRKPLLNSLDRTIYIESNPFLYGFAGALPLVFPEATVIHVVRDPRHYVRSAIDHGNAQGLKHLFNEHVPFWTAQANRQERTGRPSPLERLAKYWHDINSLIAASAHPDQYHLVRFEDMFASLKPINDIEAAVGMEPTTDIAALGERVNHSPNRKPDWEQWPIEEAQTVDRLCGPMMSEFGYGTEQTWMDMVSGRDPGLGVLG